LGDKLTENAVKHLNLAIFYGNPTFRPLTAGEQVLSDPL
jgi:hypothetical protein